MLALVNRIYRELKVEDQVDHCLRRPEKFHLILNPEKEYAPRRLVPATNQPTNQRTNERHQ